MSAHFESLESRTFLSASSLTLDEGTLTGAITALPAAAATDYNTVKADLSGAPVTKADKAIAAKWIHGIEVKYKALLKANTVGDKSVNKDVTKFDSATGSKQTAAGVKLEKDASKALAAITKDDNALSTFDVAGLTGVAEKNPSNTQLQADVATIEGDATTRFATILADATIVFSTDTTSIVTG